MKLEGAKVLLTGANGGIGQALVKELLLRGVSKVYLGVRVTGKTALHDPRLQEIALDVTNSASVEHAAKRVSDVNVLINNAGYAGFTGALTANSMTEAQQEMEINYFGPLRLTRALKDTPVFSASGAIINIVSFLALAPLPMAGTYSASKAAELALTRTFRAELRKKGTRVIAVLPVQVDTPMGKALPDPKVQPSEVAAEALDALSGTDDEIFPGAPSKGAAEAFRANPAGVLAQLSQMVNSVA